MAKIIKYVTLFNLMRENDESQSYLARLLNITPQTISKKLVGDTEWTISEIDTLCNHYNKDYYELFKND